MVRVGVRVVVGVRVNLFSAQFTTGNLILTVVQMCPVSLELQQLLNIVPDENFYFCYVIFRSH